MTNDWLTTSLEQFPYFADALLFVADENFDIFGMMPRKPLIHRGMFGRMPVRRSTCSTGVADLTAEEIIDMSGSITIQMQRRLKAVGVKFRVVCCR